MTTPLTNAILFVALGCLLAALALVHDKGQRDIFGERK